MLQDPSVSMIQAELRFVNDQCYITDMYSKFGTLIQLKLSAQVKAGGALHVQVGNVLIRFSIESQSVCYSRGRSCKVMSSEEINEVVNTIYKVLFPLNVFRI
jgi:hypothetical protein